MARVQEDPNDRLEKNGFDILIPVNSSFETANAAVLNLIGSILINGAPLASLAGFGYVHTQGSPSVTWTVNHNLGYKPTVEVFTSGNQKVLAQIDHATVNQTIITVSPALAGYARFV